MPKITFTNPKFGKRVDRKKDSNTNHKFSSKSQHLVVRQNVRSRIMLEKASRNKICGNWYPWNYCHTGKGPRPINRMVDLYANQLIVYISWMHYSFRCSISIIPFILMIEDLIISWNSQFETLGEISIIQFSHDSCSIWSRSTGEKYAWCYIYFSLSLFLHFHINFSLLVLSHLELYSAF